MTTVTIFRVEEKMKGEKFDNRLHGVISQMRYYGHENIKSKMFVDFLFICVRLHPAPKLRQSGANTATPRSLHGVLFVIYL